VGASARAPQSARFPGGAVKDGKASRREAAVKSQRLALPHRQQRESAGGPCTEVCKHPEGKWRGSEVKGVGKMGGWGMGGRERWLRWRWSRDIVCRPDVTKPEVRKANAPLLAKKYIGGVKIPMGQAA